MLAIIKQILGITDTSKDILLTSLIKFCQDEIRNYTHNNDELDNVLIQMVIFRYNTAGSEGLTSESFSGVSYSYATDYPESIMRQLRAHRKVRVI